MKHPLLVALPLALALTACNKPADEPAASNPTASNEAATTDETAAAPDSSMPPAVSAETGIKQNLVEGTDYVIIPNGQPLQPLDGKIEVAEVFAYGCGHCAAFNPMIEAWKKQQAADVRFTALPLPYSEDDPTARLYYAAESTGQLDKVHQTMFDAIHVQRALRPNSTQQEILAYLGKHGADTQALDAAMNSFSMGARVKQGFQYAQRSGVEGTPTLLINGKYRVLGRTHEDQLKVTNALIAQERAAAAN